MGKRKTVILINSLLSGGAEKQSLYLTKELSADHDVLMVVLNEKCSLRHKRFLKKHSIMPIFLKGTYLKKTLFLYSFLRKNKVEIVISYLFATNLLSAVLGKMAGVSYVIGGFRGSMGFGRIRNLIFKFLHHKLTHYTICNSHAGCDYLVSKGFDSSKLIVIHNGIEKVVLERKKVSGPIDILSVGRFDRLKDYTTALKAIGELKKANTNQVLFRYLIFGYGNESVLAEISSEIQKNQLTDCVEIVNSSDQLETFYLNSSIFLSTSIFEGLSNAIMEALTYGLPVVATNVGDNKYLIKDGYNGFICKKRDYKMIAESLQSLLGSDNLRKEMGKASQVHINQNFNLTTFRNKYLDLIAGLPVRAKL